MTAVISKKGLIVPGKKNPVNGVPLNCYVPFNIKNTDIKALAVHAHNAFECRNYLSCNSHYNLILGDFNAGNYIKGSEFADQEMAVNRQNYLLLTEGYIDLCQGEYTTEYKTYIDHILLESSFDFISKHRYRNIIVNRNKKLSDHYPITFELSI